MLDLPQTNQIALTLSESDWRHSECLSNYSVPDDQYYIIVYRKFPLKQRRYRLKHHTWLSLQSYLVRSEGSEKSWLWSRGSSSPHWWPASITWRFQRTGRTGSGEGIHTAWGQGHKHTFSAFFINQVLFVRSNRNTVMELPNEFSPNISEVFSDVQRRMKLSDY